MTASALPSLPAAEQPVARLSSPGDIVAAVPMLCGFTPSESLVLLCLSGPRSRLGLTLRIDLPEPDEDDVPELAEMLAERVEVSGGERAILILYTEHGRRFDVVDALTDALEQIGVTLTETLLVQDCRWTSYTCSRRCCPPQGTPLGSLPGPALALVAAEAALTGRRVLPDREALVASLAAPQLLAEVAGRQGLDRASDRWLLRFDEVGRERLAVESLAAAVALLDLVADGGAADVDQACSFAVALSDVLVRDEIATWCLDRENELLALLIQLVRLVPPPDDAPLCTLLAWVFYARGDGAPANVMLDRALCSEPDYSLARLLLLGLDSVVPPAEIRSMLEQHRTELGGAGEGG